MPPRDHILIIVQNLPVPLDRRVWLECQALTAAGYDVSVICPAGPGDPSRQVIDQVHIYKYPPPPPANRLRDYAYEFAYCWLRTALLSLAVWRRQPFQVLQACNPPDTFWLLALMWRRRGVRFVFDQHDLNPELFVSRFGPAKSIKQRLELAILCWLERRTYRAADRVISTNESYKRVAVERGGHDPESVTVVRSGPDTTVMRPAHQPAAPVKERFSLAYLGIMGPQDGVHIVLEVMEELVHKRGRRDVTATLMGFGDSLEDLKAMAKEKDLDHLVTFTGRVDKVGIAAGLNRADVGLCPDLKTAFNDASTMNKTMEYMAYAVPAVSFDLVESQVSAGDTILYVPSGDVQAFADSVELLLDDDELRVDLAIRARQRVVSHLDWAVQSRAYVGVYDELTGRPELSVPTLGLIPRQVRRTSPLANSYVDLREPNALRDFVLGKTSRSRTTTVEGADVPTTAAAAVTAPQG